MLCTEGSAPEISGCRFIDNQAVDTGAGIAAYDSAPLVTECVFLGNTALNNGGAAIYAGFGSTPVIRSTTIAGNTSEIGSGILCYQDTDALLEHCIIAFNPSGSATFCLNASSVTLECCTIHGNPGGDWTWCAAGQLGQDGNTDDDPMFCDLSNGNVSLQPDSPCAPENAPVGCGLVGALPVGCGTTAVGDEEQTAVDRMTPTGSPIARLRVVPNPVVEASWIAIDWLGDAPGARPALELHDVQGRLLGRSTIGMAGRRQGTQSRLPLSALVRTRTLAAGIYYLTLTEVTPAASRATPGPATRLLVIH